MNTLNKITKLASCVIMCMMLCACPTTPIPDPIPDPIPPVPTLNPVTATFDKETVDIAIGKTYKQDVTTNCPNANIVYSSSNQSVATVDPTTGKVTALAKGITTITATVSAPKGSADFEGSTTASYQVHVNDKELGTVKIGFYSSFSPDLLELITPIVSYRDKDGEHEVRLNKEICEYINEEYTFDDEKFVYETYRWTPSFVCNIYETIDFDETISVRFESNKKNIEENRKYELSASVGVNSVGTSFSYNGTFYIGTSTYISLDIKINIGEGETHDDDIYEGESVQKYIEKIIKTKQEFHVEVSKDGKVTVNGK